MHLLNSKELETSSVVANCTMNRERRLAGSNSYGRELGLDILDFLRARSHVAPVRWIDLCCGIGRALIEAATELAQDNDTKYIKIEGIDLAGLFDPNSYPNVLSLYEQAVESWEPVGPSGCIIWAPTTQPAPIIQVSQPSLRTTPTNILLADCADYDPQNWAATRSLKD